jgi:hypothetical protein
MSIRAFKAVLDYSHHTKDAFTLLLVIAESLDKDTGESFPVSAICENGHE